MNWQALPQKRPGPDSEALHFVVVWKAVCCLKSDSRLPG